ncbi:hypothetical protein AVXHC19_45830 [Acidovorax sacchari]
MAFARLWRGLHALLGLQGARSLASAASGACAKRCEKPVMVAWMQGLAALVEPRNRVKLPSTGPVPRRNAAVCSAPRKEPRP